MRTGERSHECNRERLKPHGPRNGLVMEYQLQRRAFERMDPMAKKKRVAAKRELIDTKRGGKRYVRRGATGAFKEGDQVSRSLPADRRKKAKTKVKKGQGDRGDQ